jgi:hypothetical protein
MIWVRGTHVSLYRLGRLFWLAKIRQRRTSATEFEIDFADKREILKIAQEVALSNSNARIINTSVAIDPVEARREPMRWAISGKLGDFVCFH